MSKYEQLIEYIINENEDKARELFHQIVVEKSREIYESLIDEQDLEEVGGNEVESMVDEITGDEEGLGEGEDEFGDEEGDDMGGDDLDGDDMGGDDFGGDEMDGDEFGGEEAGLEDRVMDLEDALDELKAEFDSLMGQEAGEPGMGGDDLAGDMGGLDDGMGGEEDMAEMGMMEGEEDDEEDDEEEDVEESVKESKKGRKMTEAEWLREYVDQIGDVYSQEPAQAEGNEVGAGKKAKVSAKSIVAGKNDMGGTAKNLNQADKGEDPDGKQTPEPNNEYTKGRGQVPVSKKNVNVPGGNKGAQNWYNNKQTSYEANKGAEGQTTDGKLSVDKKSLLKRIGK